MATLAVAEQGMEGFVKGLFQGSPDLSTLTHAIVRKKYLAHIGKEALAKEEKDKLKRLIEKELVQLQVEESDDEDEEPLIKLKSPAESRGQKRTHYISDSSGDEAESKHEWKKQRTVKESELSSDEEDSGIDSKKARVCRGPKHTGKSNHRDSGAEGPADTSESEEEESVKKRRGGRGKGERSGSEGEERKGGQGSGVEEEVCKTRKATKQETEESETNSENDLKGCKLQKKRAVEKGERRKEDKQRGKRETESEDESDLSEAHGKKRTDWSESKKERAGGDARKAKILGAPRGCEAREWSQSEDESDCASREKRKTQRKATGYKPQKKDVSVEESESESDDTEGKGPMRKDGAKSKSLRASPGKRKVDNDPEERQVLQKKVRNRGMKKAQGRGVSRKELEGNQKRRRDPVKQEGGHRPKGKVSRKASGSEADEEKGTGQKKKAPWNSSESESEQGVEGGKKQSGKVAVSRDDSESSSEETAGVTQREKRLSEERRVSKEVFGSESSEEEEPKKEGTEKSQHESVSEEESKSDSEGSGSESAGKVKNKNQQEKRTQKPKGRSNSKEEMRTASDKEEDCSSSEDEDSPRSSKKPHQGKDKEHRSAKGEDHPSVQRLKRYIRECGVRKNYKKLLMGCRSRKAKLEVLRQELENLGLKGTPSLAKCKALKKKLEEAAEVASLDLSNIITAEAGRPKRRNVWSLYSKSEEPPSSPEESPIRRPVADWSRLRGVISSDDESD